MTTEPTFFTAVAKIRVIAADTTADADADPDQVGLQGVVTFTPKVNSGDLILAVDATPDPTGFLAAPIAGIVRDGVLMLNPTPPATPGPYSFTPIRLLADTPLLGLAGELWYDVSFSGMSYNGRFVTVNGFSVRAANADVVVDLIRDAAPGPGLVASGVTKIAPGGVRVDGDNIIFTFGGADIPNPIPTSIFAGPTGDEGPQGSAATVDVGLVNTLEPGSSATVSNIGTPGAAVFEFGIPAGDVGQTGDTGPQGDAATITVGTVDTVVPGDPATVTNTGTTNDAVFDFGIPQGDKGDRGDAATISVGTVDTVAPGDPATVTNTGSTADAVLAFEIPQGTTGETGDKGDRGDAATITVGSVLTGSAGTSASVSNVGTATDAVFDIQIPRGDKGETGDTGSIGLTGDVGPQGDKGDAATITVGTVSTGAPGSAVEFENVGDTHDAVFDVTIPAGNVGETGSKGDKGDTGDAATIAVGTVTTLAPGSEASVTNVGTSSAAVFDIAIPKGDTGSADATEWGVIPNQPAVIAAGATNADARSVIDAEYTGNKGAAGGYASLDSAGKVPYSQLPASLMSYLGVWSAAANSPALIDGSGDVGDVYRVGTAGTVDLGSGDLDFALGDYVIYNGTTWERSASTDAVGSVNGYTGTITLTKADIGLSAVDNTADADKPISTATQTALDAKEPTISSGTTGQFLRGDKAWATLNKSAVGLGSADNTADLDKPISTATQTALNAKESTTNKGTANGYAALDSAGKVPSAQLPITQAEWDTLDGKPAVIAAGATKAAARLAIDAENTAAKAQPGGYASLDSGGVVPLAQIPAGLVITSVAVTGDAFQFYSGTTAVGDPISLLVAALDGGSPSTTSAGYIDGGTV